MKRIQTSPLEVVEDDVITLEMSLEEAQGITDGKLSLDDWIESSVGGEAFNEALDDASNPLHLGTRERMYIVIKVTK